MPIELTPFDAAPNATYLSATEALARAALLPGLTALLAQDEDALASLLLIASMDIDAAMRYQGRKYDLGDGSVSGTEGVEQEREFPRVHDDRGVGNLEFRIQNSEFGGVGGVWDWDPAAEDGAGGPVVPDRVKIATLYQAAWLLTPANSARLELIRGGLAAQSTEGASETYLKPGEIPGGLSGLCDRAQRLMEKYRLRSGRIL